MVTLFFRLNAQQPDSVSAQMLFDLSNPHLQLIFHARQE